MGPGQWYQGERWYEYCTRTVLVLVGAVQVPVQVRVLYEYEYSNRVW